MNLSDSCRMVGSPTSVLQAARRENMQFPLSLKTFISAAGCPFSKCIRIHLKVLTSPTVPLSRMLVRMRQVYQTADIGVDVVSRESLASIPNFAVLNDLNVGTCTTGTTTPQQNQLFQNRNNVGQNEIVVYFVRSLVPAGNGCATFPAGTPGAAVAQIASRWTTGHEVGHVLGLTHISGENAPACTTPDFTRLMTGCGTSNITGVPVIVQAEINTMEGSSLSNACVRGVLS
jgi:hypothetical protein